MDYRDLILVIIWSSARGMAVFSLRDISSMTDAENGLLRTPTTCLWETMLRVILLVVLPVASLNPLALMGFLQGCNRQRLLLLLLLLFLVVSLLVCLLCVFLVLHHVRVVQILVRWLRQIRDMNDRRGGLLLS